MRGRRLGVGRRFGVIVLTALLAVACKNNSPSAPTGPLDLRAVLAPGNSALVPGAAVRFEGVFGDSRCPGDAICVWAGDATVRFVVVTSGDPAASYDLHTVDLKPVRHRDLTIVLESLAPYPFASLGPIKPGDYRATVRITR